MMRRERHGGSANRSDARGAVEFASSASGCIIAHAGCEADEEKPRRRRPETAAERPRMRRSGISEERR